MLNDRLKGYQRDKELVDSISTYGVLSTEQVYALHFKGLKYGIVKARERLRKLYASKKVQRGRVDLTQSCHYYLGKKPNGTEHTVNRNWGFIYLSKLHLVHSWNKLAELRKEYVLGNLQADGFIGFKNTATGSVTYWFVESDRTDSNNKFIKIDLYDELYRKDLYTKESWVQTATKFPGVLFVTDSIKKATHILTLIDKYNSDYKKKNGYEGIAFKVITVEEIKKQIMSNKL